MIKFKRIFYILIFMMFSIFSFSIIFKSEIEASTQFSIVDHTEATYANNLRYGYNVTAGVPLSQGLLTGNPILKPIDETLSSKILKFNQTSQIAESYSATNLLSVAQQSSSLLSAGVDSKIKFVNLGAETNFSTNHSFQSVYEERYEVFYEKIVRFYIQIESSVDLKDYLTDQFKKDLYNVSNESEAKTLLEKYGTHYFTGYDFGGIMQITNYQASNSSDYELSEGMELKAKIAASAMGMGASTDFSFSENYTQKENTANTFSSYKCIAYGGNAVSGMTIDHLFTYNSSMVDGKGSYEYGRWVTSINEDKNLVIMGVPTSADNIPLWDFLDNNEKSPEIKRLLQSAYVKMCGDKYKEFQEKYPANKREIAGEDELVNGALVLGYNLEYNNYNKFYEAETLTDPLNVYRGSTINIKHVDTLSPLTKEWKIINGKEYIVDGKIDKLTGTFTVSDSASLDKNIDIGLYNGDQFITSVSFNIKQTKFSGGLGSDIEPYLISSTNDLIDLTNNPNYWGYNFKLISDIDFSGIGIDQFKSIGSSSRPFSGIFDGNHHTIKNLEFNTGQDSAIGLFGYTSEKSVIQNLNIDNLAIKVYKDEIIEKAQYQYVGGLIGYNKGKVINCHICNLNCRVQYNEYGSTAKDFSMHMGGLIGRSEGSNIERCSVRTVSNLVPRVINAEVVDGSLKNACKSSKVYFGGLIGSINQSNIENSYVDNIANAFVFCVGLENNEVYFGSLVGHTANTCNIKNSIVGDIVFNGRTITVGATNVNVNNFVGNADSSLKIVDSFAKTNTQKQNDSTIIDIPLGVSSGVNQGENIDGNFCNTLPEAYWHRENNVFPFLVSEKFNSVKPLSLDTSNITLEYYYGQEFSIDGLVVKGYNYDNSEEYIFTEYTYDASAFDSKDLSKEHQIKVFAGGHSSTFNVTVRKIKIVDIIVEANDNAYYAGDKIENESLTIKYILEDGSTIEDILNQKEYIEYASELKIENDLLVLGQNEVKVSYGDCTSSVIIEAEEKEITSVVLGNMPSKHDYIAGENFSIVGLTVVVKYEDDSEVIVNGYELEVLNNYITDGMENVVVLYDAQWDVSIPINVKYRVTFINYDDVILSQKDYEKNSTIEVPANPTREQDAQYTYEFVKWDRIPAETCTQNETYYAVYNKTLNEYTVTFKNDNGNILTEGIYKYGDTIDIPTNPIKQSTPEFSYKFVGWDKKLNETCIGDVTYTAVYIKELNKYTVKFVDYDGTLISENEYYYGNNIVIPVNPNREEDEYSTYTFMSWDKEVSSICNGNVTYKAQYNSTPKEYTVVFKNDDGTIISSNTYAYGTYIQVPSTPVKTSTNKYDYKFIDWGKVVSNICNGDVEYVATYLPILIEYTVIFKDYNGNILSQSTYHYDDLIIEPSDPVRNSDIKYTYQFTGWDKPVFKCTGNNIFTAQYIQTPIEYTVVFMNDSGSVITSDTYNYGDSITVPQNPTKAATAQYTYSFTGWDKAISYTCVGHATYIATFASSLTEHTVTFKDDLGNVITSAKYKYGDTIAVPANPTKESTVEYIYSFKGWDKAISSTCVETVVYTAQFISTPIEYTVVFKDSDDTIISEKTYKYGATIEVPANPTKEQDNYYTYAFKSWDKEVASTCNGSATYKAQYTQTKRQYSVVFKQDDNSIISEANYHYGDSIVVPIAPAKASTAQYSYTFLNWGKVLSTTCIGSVEYVATYSQELRKYTVVFKDYNGKVLSQEEYYYGSTVTIPAAPTRESDVKNDYTFKSWDQDVTIVSGNITYTATYDVTPIEYTVVFMNDSGSVITSDTYNYGDSITVPQNPTKAATTQYTYSFTGWDKAISYTCVGHATYIATFASSLTEHTVTFKDDLGNVITSAKYKYGDTIAVPANPTKESTVQYIYSFKGWDKAISSTCVETVVYTAQFTSTPIEYTVVFKDSDDTVISEKTYKYGATIEVPANPTKEQDNYYTYAFKSWDKEVASTCNGSVTYKAQYTQTKRQYSVVFKQDDNSIISEANYYYGDSIVVPIAPAKASTAQYSYTFLNWGKVLSTTCVGSVEYVATYSQELRKYTVVFKDYNGKVLSQEEYYYGSTVTIPAAPTRESDVKNDYTFKSWDQDVTVVSGNITYTATYDITPIEYTVVFMNDSGSVITSDTYNYGDSITVPQNPTKAATAQYTYSFTGWDKAISYTCVSHATYIATFASLLTEHTVTFKDDLGNVITSAKYKYGDTIVVPSNPTKESTVEYIYSFKGWDKAISSTCVETVVYTAQFISTPIEYTVVFKDSDDTIISEKTYKYGATIEVPANPTKEQDNYYTYAFKSWDKEVASTCNGSVTYKAQYTQTKRQYSVVFKQDDNSIISEANYYYGDSIVVPIAPAKASTAQYSYTFLNWGKVLSTTCVGSVEYVATYSQELRKYTVVFKDYNGKVLSQEEYYYGSTVTIPAAPTRESDVKNDYTFKSWDQVVTIVSCNITYTATYDVTPIEYTVVFSDDNGNVISSNTYHYGEQVVVPDTPTKPSNSQYTYQFNGWDKQISYTCVGHASYTARFISIPAEYLVIFLDDNGSVISSSKYKYGDIINVPANPTKESTNECSYSFAGWDKQISYVCTENVTYTAQFTSTLNEYKVVFKDYDGKILLSKNYKYGELIIIPEDPIRDNVEGYSFVFIGWDKEVASSCEGNATYTAQYITNVAEYTVIFINENGNVISSYKYRYGDVINVPMNPTKEATKEFSYTFSGWDKEIDYVCKSNATYKAVFISNVNKYKVIFKDYNGSILSSIDYAYEETINVPSEPSREPIDGYTFKFIGWDKDVSTLCENNEVYTAQYEQIANTYTIKFMDSDGTLISEVTYKHNETYTLFPTPSKDGYTFKGWVLNGKIVTEISSSVNGNLELTASWEEVVEDSEEESDDEGCGSCNSAIMIPVFTTIFSLMVFLIRKKKF